MFRKKKSQVLFLISYITLELYPYKAFINVSVKHLKYVLKIAASFVTIQILRFDSPVYFQCQSRVFNNSIKILLFLLSSLSFSVYF